MKPGTGVDFSGTITERHNVSSDATAAGTGSQHGRRRTPTYFTNPTVGTEDLHLSNNSLALWGGTERT